VTVLLVAAPGAGFGHIDLFCHLIPSQTLVTQLQNLLCGGQMRSLLVRPALTADAAGHITSVGAVLEVVASGSCQGRLELRRPLIVGLGETPHLVRCQAEITERLPERFATVDRVQELPPDFGGKPILRSAPAACSGVVALESAAFSAATARIPPRHGAVDGTSATPPPVRISSAANLLQLLQGPRRRRNQPERKPPPDDGRRDVADGGRMANGCDQVVAHRTNASVHHQSPSH
jgi:hypothetical protein